MSDHILERRITIEAAPAAVWDVIHDLRRMAEWSPQVTSTRLREGFDHVGPGARFTNRNQHGELAWTTHGEVVRFAVEREIAFRIEENWAIWSFQLAAEPGGTTLTQRRETPDGISPFSRDLTDTYLGGREAFDDLMLEGMAQTLVGIERAVTGSR